MNKFLLKKNAFFIACVGNFFAGAVGSSEFDRNDFIQAKEYQKTVSNSITRVMAVMENIPDRLLALFEGQREMSQVFVDVFDKITDQIDSTGKLTLSQEEIIKIINKVNNQYRDAAMQMKKDLMSLAKEKAAKADAPKIMQTEKITQPEIVSTTTTLEQQKTTTTASAETNPAEKKPATPVAPTIVAPVPTVALPVVPEKNAVIAAVKSADSTSVAPLPMPAEVKPVEEPKSEAKEDAKDKLKRLRSKMRKDVAAASAA